MGEYLYYIKELRENRSALASYKIVKLFEKKVFTVCYRIIRNREEAEEVAQDVFLKCFKNIDQLEDDASFSSWLMRIAFTSSIDQVRTKKQRLLSMDEIKEEHILKDSEEQRTILSESPIFEKAFDVLESDERGVINLFYQEGLSVKEIIYVTGFSASNVKIKLYRARKKIHKYLSERDIFKKTNTRS